MKSITVYKGKYQTPDKLIGVFGKKDDEFCSAGDSINKIMHQLYGHKSYYSPLTDTLYVGTNVSVKRAQSCSKKTRVYNGDGIFEETFLDEYPSVTKAFTQNGIDRRSVGIFYNRNGYKYIPKVNKSFSWG